jgi:hypothetical protein
MVEPPPESISAGSEDGDFELHHALGGRIDPRDRPRRVGHQKPSKEGFGGSLLDLVWGGDLELDEAFNYYSMDFTDAIDAGDPFGHELRSRSGCPKIQVRSRNALAL